MREGRGKALGPNYAREIEEGKILFTKRRTLVYEV